MQFQVIFIPKKSEENITNKDENLTEIIFMTIAVF